MSTQNTTAASGNYKESYSRLREISTLIKNQVEPDIDSLVPLVDEAMSHYQLCKQRIDAVKAVIGEKMPENAQQD